MNPETYEDTGVTIDGVQLQLETGKYYCQPLILSEEKHLKEEEQ